MERDLNWLSDREPLNEKMRLLFDLLIERDHSLLRLPSMLLDLLIERDQY